MVLHFVISTEMQWLSRVGQRVLYNTFALNLDISLQVITSYKHTVQGRKLVFIFRLVDLGERKTSFSLTYVVTIYVGRTNINCEMM